MTALSGQGLDGPGANPWRGLPQAVLAIIVVVIAARFAPAQGYYLNILMQAATYAIGVLGLVVVLGYCGQISIAQAAFFGIGAYAVALGTVDLHINFFVALFIGVVLSGLCGLILGLGTLRLGGHYLGMITISFQQILTLVLTNWIEFTHGPDGVRNVARPTFFGFSFDDGNTYLALILAAAVMVTLFVWRL